MSYIEDLALLNNPFFEDFLRIAAKNLPVSKRAYPWIGLSHGVKLLENDDELAQYLCAYGKMHKEKIDLALRSIREPSRVFTKDITIIDWGCGQGLASICFFDYLRTLGIAHKVNKVVLIEPSKPALNRAQEHLIKYIDGDKIISVNKYINDVAKNDISETNDLVIHFFSNILDIPNVNIQHLANLIKDNIISEQLFFCVGPQNLGVSKISEFAKMFDIKENELIKEHTGKLSGRGTVNLLVFRIESKTVEVVKVEYRHRRNLSISHSMSLQRVLKNAKPQNGVAEKALQFYTSAIELERMKTSTLGNTYHYPLHVVTENGITKITIDVQENPDFESLFRKNSNEKWPKNLNINIGLILENKSFPLLQYLYPYEDIKNINIENERISLDLSSFALNIDIAEEMEIGEEQQGVIESIISDTSTNWESLESILKDAISNDVTLDSQLYLSLSSENPALAQINSELKKLTSLPKGALLNQFLNGIIPENSVDTYDEDILLQVTPIDESQRKAIATAFNSKVSVITGPPGTGKTQMILNLIVNAFMNDKTVLIASKNNKAVDNIKDRYDSIDNSHYLLRFGSKDAVNRQLLPFLDNILRDIPEITIDDQHYTELKNKYRNYCDTIQKCKRKLNELLILEEEYKKYSEKISLKERERLAIQSDYETKKAALLLKYQDVMDLSHINYEWRQELINVKTQINILQSKYSGIGKLLFDLFSKKKQSVKTLNALQQTPPKYIEKIEDRSHISCVADVKNGQDLIRLLEVERNELEIIQKCIEESNNTEKLHNNSFAQCNAEIEKLQQDQIECKRSIDSIIASHSQILSAIEDSRNGIKDISTELHNLSVLSRLRGDNVSAIISRYKNYLPDRIPWKDSEVSIYKNNASSFLDVFRLNAVTNLSIKNSYPLSSGFFDIVIIDEASQCDVASALPLIYRAKQLVVIGDPLQLKHISAINVDEEQEIKKRLKFEENPLVKYADYSLWDYCCDLITTAGTNNRPVVLDCHYRCHPQIIGYSNRMFYEKRLGTTLNVKTIEKNPLLKQKGIIWEDVRGEQRSERLNINDAEVKKCISIASRLADEYLNISIGIISPFKHQAQEINANIPDNLKDRIVADTVHKFQGDERDVIIYSLVVTDNSPDSKIRWIDYSVPNLVNVAVTRARTTLFIVGNKKYVQTHSRKDLPLGNLLDYTETNAVIQSVEPTKTYIVDTNVFVQSPDIIDHINPRDNIVLSAKVIDELDKLKVTLTDESKRNVETALKNINMKFSSRNIRMECADFTCLPPDFAKKNPDNLILSIALKFRNQNAILLTSDNGFQIKAKGLGLNTISLNEYINTQRDEHN